VFVLLLIFVDAKNFHSALAVSADNKRDEIPFRAR
jgi:hypothetical protein